MKKREFLKSVGLGSLAFAASPLDSFSCGNARPKNKARMALIFPDKKEVVVTEEGLVMDDDNMVEAPLIFEVMLRLSEIKDEIEKSSNPMLRMMTMNPLCPIPLLDYHPEVDLKFSINGEDFVNYKFINHPFKIEKTILSGACRANF